MSKGVLQPATRGSLRNARTACRVVGAVAVAVFAMCFVDMLSMIIDPDRSTLTFDEIVMGGTVLVVVVCAYLASVFDGRETVVPDDTEKWLAPAGEVPDEGGFRRVRAVYRRRVLLTAGTFVVLVALVMVDNLRPDPGDWFFVLTLPPAVGVFALAIMAVNWGARYRAVLRTGWRAAESSRHSVELRVSYADRSAARLQAATFFSFTGIHSTRPVLVGGVDRTMVLLYPKDPLAPVAQQRARPVAALGVPRHSPPVSACLVSPELLRARFRQAVCRVVRTVSAVVFLAAVADFVSVLPADDSTYTEMSLAVFVGVATLVIGVFAMYWLGVFADHELTLRASGDDDTPLWLPAAKVTANAAAARRVLGVFWRSVTYATLCLGVLVACLLTTPEAGHGTVVGLSIVGFLVFAATSAKWRARYRETRRTGWRRGYATAVDRGVVVEVRYPDHSRVRTIPARSTRRRFRYVGDDQEVWVGGTGQRMVVAYPTSVVPVLGVAFRRRPLERTPKGKQLRSRGKAVAQ